MNAISALGGTAGERPQPKLVFTRRFDKIVELLVYLAGKKPDRTQYQAVKLFYLADKEHFNRYGRPISFEIYYALDYGPVATTVLDLIKGDRTTLKQVGIPRLPIEIAKREHIYTLVRPERVVEYDVFSKSDLRVFDEIIEEYGDKSFDEFYKITHDHVGYKNAWNSRVGNAKRSLMHYEDMLEEGQSKWDLIDDLMSVSKFMR